MDFDKRTFEDNKKFLFILLGIVLIGIIISLVMQGVSSSTLEEKELQSNGDSDIHQLVIHEVMTSNGGAHADANGKLYDWMELYNGSSRAINLKNYGLSDRDNQIKWLFPDVTIEANSYLVVYFSGDKQDGLYANFKLSSAGGEILALKNANGKVVDAVETVPLEKNMVMARDLNGNWFASSKVTPGYANTEEGYNTYLESLMVEDSSIVLNEILPRNKGNFEINDKYSGYVEIMNTGKSSIDLANYGLSNSVQVPYRYQFPSIILGPNEVVVIYMDSMLEETKEYYSNFKLEAKTGTVILSNNEGKIVDKVSYDNLANGMSYVKQDGNWYSTNQISPGYVNTVDGSNSFAKEHLSNPSTLMINEVMNSNSSYLPQNGGEYYDWIELKNNSKETISLKDYFLTTNDDLNAKYELPDVTLKAGEKYVIIASGDSNLSNNSYKHLDFKLSETESLYLVHNEEIIDSIFIANIPVGYSMGRNSKSGFYYFSTPTPKKDNGDGTYQIAYTPTFDVAPGVYNNIEQIELKIDAGGTIYYTLDGSVPTTSSKKYSDPLLLSKTSVVRAISVEKGKIKSEVITGSYIVNENHTMPVISVSMKPSDFNYIQNNMWVEGIEVAAHVELYEDGDSFSLPCGFRLFGGSTRGLAKKSFALKFRKKYGASELHYQVFENRDFSAFNTLVLRSGSQDYSNAMMRDVLMTSLVDGMINVDVQAYKPAILYINGKYWGIYNIREKVDDEFVSNHYNVEKDKADVVSIMNTVSAGSIQNYSSLVNYMSSHDLSINENYEYVKTKLNMESFVDFWIAETWVTNNDILNTRFFSHPDVDDGRFHMIFYDLDWAMYNYSKNYFNFTVQPEGMSDFKVSTLMMRKLIQNSEFKKLYLERLSYQLENVWNKERVMARIEELYQKLLPEMSRNQERWGLTMDNWEKEVERLRNYANVREGYLLKHAKSFFGLNTEEFEKYFGDNV